MGEFDARGEGWYDEGGLLAGDTSLTAGDVARWYVDEFVPLRELREKKKP